MTTKCIDCGLPGVTGALRCRACHGRLQKREAAEALLEQDREILGLRAEKLTFRQIGVRVGKSHTRVGQLLKDARRREGVRAELGLELAQP